MNIDNIISLAGTIARAVAAGKQTLESLRAVVAREHPGDLAAFDAAVASARKPWNEADAGAKADEGTGTTDD